VKRAALFQFGTLFLLNYILLFILYVLLHPHHVNFASSFLLISQCAEWPRFVPRAGWRVLGISLLCVFCLLCFALWQQIQGSTTRRLRSELGLACVVLLFGLPGCGGGSGSGSGGGGGSSGTAPNRRSYAFGHLHAHCYARGAGRRIAEAVAAPRNSAAAYSQIAGLACPGLATNAPARRPGCGEKFPLRLVADPVDHLGAVVAHEQRAISGYRNSHGPAVY
jgi:hypothetical protein